MLNNHQRKASLGASLCIAGMFSASAQDLLQDVPVTPTPGVPSPPPVVSPTLPGTLDPTTDPGAFPSFLTDTPTAPGFNPPATGTNPLIPGPDLLPVPGVTDSETLDPDADLLTEDDEVPDAPTFLEGEDSNGNPDLPEVLQNIPAESFNGGQRDQNSEGLVIGITLAESYTSNLQIAEAGGDSTLYTQIRPSFSYRSAPAGEAFFVLAASYSPVYSYYHSGGEGGVFDHDFDASFSYEGERLVVALTGSFLRTNAANRFTETFSEDTEIGFGIDASYIYSDKTSLYSTMEYQTRTSDDGSGESGELSDGDSDLFSYSLSALWEYSPDLSIGPAIRYAANDAEAFGETTSFSISAEARYTYSELTKFTSTLGIERTSPPGDSEDWAPTGTFKVEYQPNAIWNLRGELRYESIPITESNAGSGIGGRDPDDNLNGAASDGGQQFNASIGVTYKPSEVWTFTGGFRHRTAPSFINEGESIIDTGFNIGATRQIGDAMINVRTSYSFTDFESNSEDSREDQTFKDISLNYTHPNFFNEDLTFTSQLSYGESTGGNPYNETRATLALIYQF